jgi:hypothetical protein|tara:strand:- start:151 stop:378 length:228 start_codon:yes stop_codon:yes gene_type:complete
MPKANKKTKEKQSGTSITSKTQLKDIDKTFEILEQKAGVVAGKGGGLPSTYTKIRLRDGTIKETYGERYGKPTDS